MTSNGAGTCIQMPNSLHFDTCKSFEPLHAKQELACGYMSGKLLLKLDATNYILQNHALEDFAFMEDPANSRNRSTFYFILARLLFQDEASAKTKFKGFIAPLQQAGLSPYSMPDICMRQYA